MTLEPQIHTITKIVNKLGFKVQKSAIQPKGKNDEMEVILAAREDEKTLLSLSYYSNMLLMKFIIDCAICYVLER